MAPPPAAAGPARAPSWHSAAAAAAASAVGSGRRHPRSRAPRRRCRRRRHRTPAAAAAAGASRRGHAAARVDVFYLRPGLGGVWALRVHVAPHWCSRRRPPCPRGMRRGVGAARQGLGIGPPRAAAEASAGSGRSNVVHGKIFWRARRSARRRRPAVAHVDACPSPSPLTVSVPPRLIPNLAPPAPFLPPTAPHPDRLRGSSFPLPPRGTRRRRRHEVDVPRRRRRRRKQVGADVAPPPPTCWRRRPAFGVAARHPPAPLTHPVPTAQPPRVPPLQRPRWEPPTAAPGGRPDGGGGSPSCPRHRERQPCRAPTAGCSCGGGRRR